MTIGFLKFFLEKIDYWRDRLLFPLIKKYWPRKILPNHLSILRMILGAGLATLLFSGFKNKFTIIFIFCLALFLDVLDGSVARALNKKTKIGAFLDPVADKILIIPIAIYSLAKYYFWLLFLLLLVEGINTLSAIYYRERRLFMEANIFGKTKMVLQSVAFGMILLAWPLSLSQFSIILLVVSVVFSVLSFIFKELRLQNQKKFKLK